MNADFGRVLAVAAILAGYPTVGAAQGGAQRIIGIVPFSDATSSGNHNAGTDIARTMVLEIANTSGMRPRLLALQSRAGTDELDRDAAIEAGRVQQADLLFFGTVLEARTVDSSKRGWVPTIKGQSGHVDLRRVKATIVIQGELYDVGSGGRLWSQRVTGEASHNAFGGSAYTRFGSWGTDTYSAFLESPLGEAMQQALAELVRKVASSPAPAK